VGPQHMSIGVFPYFLFFLNWFPRRGSVVAGVGGPALQSFHSFGVQLINKGEGHLTTVIAYAQTLAQFLSQKLCQNTF